MDMKRSSIAPVVVVAITLLAFWPFFSRFQPAGHDAHFHPLRIMALADASQAGWWIPRWCRTLGGGLGYPIFNYYGWLSYAPPAFLHLLGLDAVLACNVSFLLYAALLASGSYKLGLLLGGQKGALLCWGLYTFAPYQLVNVYVRATLPEFAAGAIVPWAAVALLTNLRRPRPLPFTMASALLAALVICHNIAALEFLPLLVLLGCSFVLFSRRRISRRWLAVLGPAAASLGLSAFFWLPMIFELHAIQIANVFSRGFDWRGHFVYTHQLFARTWGYGFSRVGLPDSMSLQLGPAQILTLCAGLLVVLDRRFTSAHKISAKIIIRLTVAAVFTAFLTTWISMPFWQCLPPLRLVQFPWRLLLPAAFLTACGGAVLGNRYFSRMNLFPSLAPKWKAKIPFLLTGLSIVAAVPYCQPSKWTTTTTADLRQKLHQTYVTTTVLDEYRPIHASKDADLSPYLSNPPRSRSFQWESSLGTTIIPVFWTENWRVSTTQGNPVSTSAAPGTGLLTFASTHPKSTVTITWHSTPIEKLGQVISVLTAASLIVSLLIRRKNLPRQIA